MIIWWLVMLMDNTITLRDHIHLQHCFIIASQLLFLHLQVFYRLRANNSRDRRAQHVTGVRLLKSETFLVQLPKSIRKFDDGSRSHYTCSI